MTVETLSRTAALTEVMEFVWLEADRLDHGEFDEWLTMWTDDARYIVPIEPGVVDFEKGLNYAYDDKSMRAKRVQRLMSGASIAASPFPRTIRSVSRFRILTDDGTIISLRAMQRLTEYRRERERCYTANLEYLLRRTPDGLKIERKVIRLINSDGMLGGISYIL